LSLLIRDRSDLILERADFDLLYDRGYFWTDAIDTPTEKAMPLERPLVELLKERRKKFGESPAWKYDPIVSEGMHRAAETRLKALKSYPKDFRDQLEYWKSLTSRGVSTVTDSILSHLLAVGTADQISELELYAVIQGRVFDQGLRDEFALRQIKSSPAYRALMDRKKDVGSDRTALITDVITLAQTLLTDLGLRYREFMEQLSEDIQSTYDEAEMIDQAKAKRLGVAIKENKDQVTDSRIRMFQDIIPHIKTWKDQNQFEFLLYLRGSIEATPFIRGQFPQFGPERIRQIYQGLPLEGARFAVEMYLSQTLLARKGVDSSWGKKLIAYLVKPTISAEETAEVAKLPPQERLAYQQRLEATHRYSQLLLEGLLVGIDKAGNTRLQKSVLSALIAMKPNQKNSVGETIKKILEQFPGVGPKVGQFLVATQLLPPDINEVLIGTQDGTLPPERFETYVDISQIVGRGKDIGVELFNFLGGGSIKYSRSAKERTTGWQVALQIFREDVQNSVDVNIKAINYMIAHLIKVDGKQWAFLKVIVDGAMHAVEREREFLKEAEKTKTAREKLYKDRFNDEHFTVQVPIQLKLNERLLASRFASGKPFWKLSKEDQQIVGEKILAMESELLYPAGNFSQDHPFVFDTDRHAGNYLIDVTLKNGKKHYTIYPIDFGQLTQITVAQRDRVAEMMALAVMFSNGGSNEWLGQKLASLFGLQGKVVSELQKNLDAFFPVSKAHPDNSIVTAYFSLIAAINETIHPTKEEHPTFPQDHPDLKTGRLDFIYTDYLRAIIQFNQYENNIVVTKSTRSPRSHLEAQTKKALAVYLRDVRLSKVQQALVQAQNVRNWVTAKRTGAKYEPINIRMTERELESKSLMKQGTAPFQRTNEPVSPGVCSSAVSGSEVRR
ncbi:MAG: hypothetical protein K2X47_17030, partial [Bdellovibrionales bacterium]|nr:hypothetical protein [Bdellovibrionales bacterium]